MTDQPPVGEARYVSLTTFRRTGEGVSTAVWCAPLPDGRVAIWTNATSGKIKRLARDAHVTLRPCDVRGRVAQDSPTYDGTAEVVRSGGLFQEALGRVRSKYGVLGWATMTLRLSKKNDAAIVVTLASA